VLREVNYIISGAILLIIGTVFFASIQKISLTSVAVQNDFYCGTESVTTEISLSANALRGKALFNSNCASCHNIFKDMTGPSLLAVINREPWTDRQNLYSWINNPAAFMKTNAYARGLKEKYGTMMTAFPDLSHEEIDMIFEYLNLYTQTTLQ
jgi:cytochrome c2